MRRHPRPFVPKRLMNPRTPRRDDPRLVPLLSAADRALGRLSALATHLPDIETFLPLFLLREAASSHAIDAARRANAREFLEMDEARTALAVEAREGVNIWRLTRRLTLSPRRLLPSLKTILHLHRACLRGVAGEFRVPGGIRTVQTTVGLTGTRPPLYVPPPPAALPGALGDLGAFLCMPMHPLIRAGLAHAQFETIHPFIDGNGPVGRMLVTLVLQQEVGRTTALLAGISPALASAKADYYAQLNIYRFSKDGTFAWLSFFLQRIVRGAERSERVIEEAIAMKRACLVTISSFGRDTGSARALLAGLFQHPLIDAKQAAAMSGLHSPASTASLLAKFVRRRILEETTGRRRNRRYAFQPLLNLCDQR